jgi:hypothetical protein
MENLTVHQRINFKSHYPPLGFERIKRIDHYSFQAEKDSNSKSFDIPYWNELQGNRFSFNSPFRNKF